MKVIMVETDAGWEYVACLTPAPFNSCAMATVKDFERAKDFTDDFDISMAELNHAYPKYRFELKEISE